MYESDLNGIINRSLNKLGFSHKIADPMGGSGRQNPFDGFSVLYKKPWYWESKIQKEFKAFNFNKIEEHQMKNLLDIKHELEDKCFSLIILGIFISRKSYDLFFFDIDLIKELKSMGKKSINKKELISLKDNGMSLPVIRDDKRYWIADVSAIPDKILYDTSEVVYNITREKHA